MTYCVGLAIDRGLVFMSDTRTNAGMDSISTFRKMHVWEEPGERVVVLMSAGNLATTQAVVSLLDERSKAVAERTHTLLETPSMYQTARLVGNTVKEVILASSPTGEKADSYFNASFVLGGQIKGSPPRLFMIYPEGNFIEATEDTPFFQVGETKYGKQADNLDERRATIWMRIWCRGGGDDRGIDCRAQEALWVDCRGASISADIGGCRV